MFFPERIISINSSDKVLEIGPGATPYFRSDVFLELDYKNESERIAQSGHVGILKTEKEIVYYNGGRFPFEDKEFDYVICSHVLEHVPDANIFLMELQRVGKKGYLEFPTVYYDYIYNFPEHTLFLLERDGVINWMTKEESGLLKFASIQNFFYRTCELRYLDLINDCKNYFFQGFEWFDKIESKRISDINLLTYPIDEINLPPKQKTAPYINLGNVSLKKLIKFKIKRFFK